MAEWGLPESFGHRGREWPIRSDFRCILDILAVLSDTELGAEERGYVAMSLFYPELDSMPRSSHEDAAAFMNWFIDGGQERTSSGARLMDWEQDYPLIVAPVNRVLGCECREAEHLHWWTFLGAYMEIGDCLFANVVAARRKKAAGKMDKADRDFYRRNRALVDLRPRQDAAASAALDEWIG